MGFKECYGMAQCQKVYGGGGEEEAKVQKAVRERRKVFDDTFGGLVVAWQLYAIVHYFPVFSFIRREFCIHCLPPSLDNTFQFAQFLHVTQPVWVSYRLFFHKPTIFSYEHCPCVSKFSESRIIIYTNNKVTYI